MIAPEQLAQALDRIDPRDRELLSLSLGRRVPDEALARVLAVDSGEVARRRARAIERLADELQLQRGEDLGEVLKALLEPETWSVAAATFGAEFAAGGGAATRLAAVPAPAEPPEPTAAPPLAPVPPPLAEADAGPAAGDGDQAEAEADPADQAASAESAGGAPEFVGPNVDAAAGSSDLAGAPAEPEAQSAEPPRPPPEPVLEILAEPDRDDEGDGSSRRPIVLALVGVSVAALVGAAGVVGATQFGEGEGDAQRGGGGGDDGTRHFVPERAGPLAAPFPSDPETISCYSTATVSTATVLYRQPGGRRRVKIAAKTEWNSPRVLGVVSQRGEWLGVQAPELRNGEMAWLRRSQARVDCSRWSLHADLSRRLIYVRRDGHTVRELAVAIGRATNPTPTGRFTVTDKLEVTDPSSPYGCCVLALTGHQTRLPATWTGGDRLAVHATSEASSIGNAVSLGCLRAKSRQVRWLIETIPLGAPIFIRS